MIVDVDVIGGVAVGEKRGRGRRRIAVTGVGLGPKTATATFHDGRRLGGRGLDEESAVPFGGQR